ncbi:MAG: fibronectin type III-like domain-contianing protein, partial [Clostridia bacterium]|nr:fibronectin type III-like domain-contianing protein [Clostridia bacterium]
DLPPFDDYEMEHGRTYMYAEKTPLWPFGFGLSYTRFAYSGVNAEKTPDGYGWEVSVRVKNVGDRSGEEVAELYLDSAGLDGQPKFRLRGFERLRLAPDEEKICVFRLTEEDFTLYDADGNAKFVPGRYRAFVGGSLPDSRGAELGAAQGVSVEVEV